MILQDDIFLNSSSYTLRDHLNFNCALKSNSNMKYVKRALAIDEMTTSLGINHILDIPIELISGGEKNDVPLRQVCLEILEFYSLMKVLVD